MSIQDIISDNNRLREITSLAFNRVNKGKSEQIDKNDIKKAMEPLYTTAPEQERAGLGFAVMQSFCDAVSVRSVPGKGTSVTLRKKLSLRCHNV